MNGTQIKRYHHSENHLLLVTPSGLFQFIYKNKVKMAIFWVVASSTHPPDDGGSTDL
jgi:hypothetical protein